MCQASYVKRIASYCKRRMNTYSQHSSAQCLCTHLSAPRRSRLISVLTKIPLVDGMIISGSIAEARQLHGAIVNRGTKKQNKHSTELNIRVPVRGFSGEKLELELEHKL